MGEWAEKLHKIKIDFGKVPDENFLLEIDGKKIEGVSGVVIESGMGRGRPFPFVTVSFWARRVEGDVRESKLDISDDFAQKIRELEIENNRLKTTIAALEG